MSYTWPIIGLTFGLQYGLPWPGFTLVTYTTAYTLGPELDEMHIDATPPACSTRPSTAPHGRAHRLPLLLLASWTAVSGQVPSFPECNED